MNGSPIICPRCGQSNREQARFCIQCGHALAAQPAATASPRSRSWRGLLIGLLALVVVVGLGAAAVWWLKRPPELPAASQATPDGQSTEPGISPTGVSPTAHPPGEAAVSQPATLEATDALEEAEPSPGLQPTSTPSLPPLPPLAVINAQNAAQLQPLRRLGNGLITGAVAYSSDGRLLAVATTAVIYVYNAATLDEVHVLEHGQVVGHMAFSPGGDRLAAATDSGVTVWALESGAVTAHWTGTEANGHVTAFSPDLETVVFNSGGAEVMLRRVNDGTPLITLSGLTYSSVAEYSQDGQTLVTEAAGVVQRWRVSDGTLLATMTGHQDSVSDVAISPDGQTVASVSHNEGALRVWQAEDGAQLFAIERGTPGGGSVAFSPDGQTLAVQGMGQTIQLLNATDGATLATWPAWAAPFEEQLQFSPDGKTLLSSGLGVPVQRWRVADGVLLGLLPTYLNGAALYRDDDVAVEGLTFSADGQMLGVAADAGPHLWNVIDGVPLLLPTGHDPDYGGGAVVAHSSDGRWVASGGYDEIRIWRAGDLAPVTAIQMPFGYVYDLAFSPDGQTLASASYRDQYNNVYLWRVADWSFDRVQAAPDAGQPINLSSVSFSPDSQTLATGAGDLNVYLWRTSDGEPVDVIPIESSANDTPIPTFSPNGQTLAVRVGNAIQLWNVSDKKLTATLEGHTALIGDLAFSPDGLTLASIAAFDETRLWQLPDGDALWAVGTPATPNTYGQLPLAFSPDGQTLWAGNASGQILARRTSDGQLLDSWEVGPEPISAIALSPDGQTLVSGGEDSVLRLWQTSDGTLLKFRAALRVGYFSAFAPDLRTVVNGDPGGFSAQSVADGATLATHSPPNEDTSWEVVAFSPDGRFLAVGAVGSGSVRLWQTTDWTATTAIGSHAEGTGSIAFSPDGATLATGSTDYDNGLIVLTRVADNSRLHVLEGHDNSINDMTFSPDGQTLISASYDDTVKMWRVSDGALLATLEPGYESAAGAVAVSPDGGLVVTGEQLFGNTLHLWRATDGALLATLQGGYSGGMGALAFSPDGTMLAAGAEDGTVTFWGIPE